MNRTARSHSAPPTCSDRTRASFAGHAELAPIPFGADFFSSLAGEVAAEVERSVQAKLDEHHARFLESISQALRTVLETASSHNVGADNAKVATISSLPHDGRGPLLRLNTHSSSIPDRMHGHSISLPQPRRPISDRIATSSKSITSGDFVRRTRSCDVRIVRYQMSEEFLKYASMHQHSARDSLGNTSRQSRSAPVLWNSRPEGLSQGLVPFPSFTSTKIIPALRPSAATRSKISPVRHSRYCLSGSSDFADIRKYQTSDLLHAIKVRDQQRTDEVIEDEDGVLDVDTSANVPRGGHPSAKALTAPDPCTPLVLRVAGLVPWWCTPWKANLCAAAYQWAVLAVATLAALAMWQRVLAPQHAGACAGDGLFSDLALSAGSVLGLLGLGVHLRSGAFLEVLVTLEEYGQRWDMLQVWHKDKCMHLATSFFAWAFILAFRVHNEANASMDCGLDSTSMLQLIAFALLTGLLMCMCFCMLSVCSALSTMIDLFCLRLLEKDSLEDAVLNWNILQAVLRKSSYNIQRCFFVLQGTALTMLMLTIADVFVRSHYDFSHIPEILLAVAINRIVYSAAAVTDKCCHVPSLISSFCNTIDTERQYVTQHIIHSAAGFYVFEVLLTSNMAMKFTYFAVFGAFTLATKVLSS